MIRRGGCCQWSIIILSLVVIVIYWQAKFTNNHFIMILNHQNQLLIPLRQEVADLRGHLNSELNSPSLWVATVHGQSCSAKCRELSLTCFDHLQFSKNEDVETCAKMTHLAVNVLGLPLGSPCVSPVDDEHVNRSIPSWGLSKSDVSVSSVPGRNESSFDGHCDFRGPSEYDDGHRPNSVRLCVCNGQPGLVLGSRSCGISEHNFHR